MVRGHLIETTGKSGFGLQTVPANHFLIWIGAAAGVEAVAEVVKTDDNSPCRLYSRPPITAPQGSQHDGSGSSEWIRG
jgi:hypothetical protein